MQVEVVTFAQDIEGCKVYPDYMDALHSDFMRLGSIRAALDEPKVVGLDFLAMYRKDRTARGKGKVRTIGGAKADIQLSIKSLPIRRPRSQRAPRGENRLYVGQQDRRVVQKLTLLFLCRYLASRSI